MKKLNIRRLVKFIVSVMYIAFMIASMFQHNIITLAEFGAELEMYALIYAVLYIILDKFKFNEIKELFIER